MGSAAPRGALESPAVTLPALVWLLLATIWGSTWLVITVGLADLPPVTFAAIRWFEAIAPRSTGRTTRPVRRDIMCARDV